MISKKLIFCLGLLVAIGLAIGTYLIRSNHSKLNNQSPNKVEASSSQKELSSSDDWQLGTLDNISNAGGDLSMNDKAEQAVDLTDPVNVSAITCDASPDHPSATCSSALADNAEDGFWWSADHPPTSAWWVIQLTSSMSFSKVQFALAPLCSYRRLMGSNDGINYSLITNSDKHVYVQTHDISSQPAYKYYKLEAEDTNSGWDGGWPCPTEPPLEMWGFKFLDNATATHTSGATQIFGTDDFWQWQTFSPTYTKPANTDIQFRFRTSADGSTWNSWTAYQSVASGGSLDLISLVASWSGSQENPGTFYKYVQVESKLTSTDGVSTPTLSEYSIGFHTNRPPDKPTAMTAVIGN